jgi:HJR/Mrr/RecB family endonuclease
MRASDTDPIDHEQMIAHGLTGLGWRTHLARDRFDQGIVVIAQMRGKRVLIQCIRHSTAIGHAAVQAAYMRKSSENTEYAAVVSSAPFTPRARQLAESAGVILLHQDALSQLEPQIFGTITVHPGVRIADDPDFPDDNAATLDLTPTAFEQSVAYGLKCIGWKTRLTGPGKDHYVDVIAAMRGKLILIQCPGFVSPIRATAVQDLDDARARAGGDYAAIVSNAEFTSGARDLATLIGVVLLRHDNLTQLEALVFGAATHSPIAAATPDVAVDRTRNVRSLTAA